VTCIHQDAAVFSGVTVSTRPYPSSNHTNCGVSSITLHPSSSLPPAVVSEVYSSSSGSPAKHSPTTVGTLHPPALKEWPKSPNDRGSLLTTLHPGQSSREPSGRITNTQPRPIPPYFRIALALECSRLQEIPCGFTHVLIEDLSPASPRKALAPSPLSNDALVFLSQFCYQPLCLVRIVTPRSCLWFQS
jgi:hypothetical protein